MDQKVWEAAARTENDTNQIDDKVKKLHTLATDLFERVSYVDSELPTLNAVVGEKKEVTQGEYLNTLDWIREYAGISRRVSMLIDYIGLCDELVVKESEHISELLDTIRGNKAEE